MPEKSVELTPLMQQYYEIKKNHLDAILFFRLGDFYEMFGEDAKLASPLLELTLTARNRMPMCGIPHFTAHAYIARLVRAGYKVAVCEQQENDSGGEKNKGSRGLFHREVVRIFTPGTVVEDSLLEAKTNNFLLIVSPNSLAGKNSGKQTILGLVFVDVSTGQSWATEIADAHHHYSLATEISHYLVREAILPRSWEKHPLVKFFQHNQISVNFVDDFYFLPANAGQQICQRYGLQSLKSWPVEDHPLLIGGWGAALQYLEKNHKNLLEHLNRFQIYSTDNFLALDSIAVRNLELVEGLNTRTGKGSLLELLDLTLTPMGGRLLRQSLLQPLKDRLAINRRLDKVAWFKEEASVRSSLRERLSSIIDLERLLGRLSAGSANARDMVALKNSLRILPLIKKELAGAFSESEIIPAGANPLAGLLEKLVDLSVLCATLEQSIVDEPPAAIKEGRFVRAGCSAELDQLRQASHSGKNWLVALEQKERERTGIKSLKVGFNNIFGYYLEISSSNLHLAPPDYIRKQTMTNAERFITAELKEKESLILGAEEKSIALEYQIFQEVSRQVLGYRLIIQSVSSALAELDFFACLGEAAGRYNYCRPEIADDGLISIKDGRHPVVERMLQDKGFVPNDTVLNSETDQLLIITGPNMAGKSTYLRQVGLIALLAQMGSFVPAKEARIGIVDRIFTRIGAADNLAQGESTFMVEMQETANILHNATERSLLILDEIGRGTSTFDGISIAWAVAEYLVRLKESSEKKRGPRTLFATHYFELTELEQQFKSVKNYNVAVREWGEEIVFLRKIVPGSADRSYGIQVAKLAGLPAGVIGRAGKILTDLEKNAKKEFALPVEENNVQPELFVPFQAGISDELKKIAEEIKTVDLNNLTPMEALLKIKEWKEKIEPNS
ncbi:MAG: DNA mismatch repair protein MutS [Elusimicrobiota bacterium]